MPKMNPEARMRLVGTAADMLRRRGMNATSIRELAKAAKAPLGSTYHYFPGGKSQVVTEAIQFAGDLVAEQLRQALEKGLLEGIQTFIAQWRDIILQSNFQAGCTVLAASIEEPVSDELVLATEAAAEAFRGWETLLIESFSDSGMSEDNAKSLATTVVSTTEGAVVLCRAKRSVEPLQHISKQLSILVQANLSHVG